MLYSQLFGKSSKSKPGEAEAINARLLLQGGFVNQLAAGIYTYLPLGLRVLRKIKNIIREEMDAIGGQEVLMPALHPKSLYDATDRWEKIDVMFKTTGAGNKEYGLSSTAEEVITPLVKQYATSYKDFPLAIYQIQDKFRDEPRAKSGLLRGREFLMKDLYSFHLDEKDFLDFYEKAKQSYLKIYQRCGLDAIVAAASGGVFTDKFSHEFQVPTEAGEDHIYIDRETGEAFNREIISKKDLQNTEKYEIKKAIEVGNIFPLECRFSNAFDFSVKDADNNNVQVIMGCYGIGPSRVMGSIVEVHHDERGIRWPKSVSPFDVHLVSLRNTDKEAKKMYDQLVKKGVEVLWDDRDASPGEKFATADLIGIPLRLVLSEKTLGQDSVEWKERGQDQVSMVKITAVKEKIVSFLQA